MLPHTYWLRPDPDGRQRRANEERAADLYQGMRKVSRAVSALAGAVVYLGAAAYRGATLRRPQADLPPTGAKSDAGKQGGASTAGKASDHAVHMRSAAPALLPATALTVTTRSPWACSPALPAMPGARAGLSV